MPFRSYIGLGEMNADQLRETKLDPNARNLLKVEVDQTDEADQIFTALMGDRNEEPRGSLHGVNGTSLWFNSVFMVQCTAV